MYLLEKTWTWQMYSWWLWDRSVSFSEDVFACEIRGASVDS